MAPSRSSTHGSTALSSMFKGSHLHHHNNDSRHSLDGKPVTGPLPKHPTNKKPYPHSPAGSIPNPHGDTISLTYDHLDIERSAKEVQSKWAGATVLFLGSTREDWADTTAAASTSSLRVTRLEYECYTPLALKTMRAILQRARSTPSGSWPPADLTSRDVTQIDESVEAELTARDMAGGSANGASGASSPRASFSPGKKDKKRSFEEEQRPPSAPQDAVLRIHLTHRLGPVPVGQPSILLAVSSPHRRRAFEVAEWVLEEVKRVVPIWKREVRESLGGKESTEGANDSSEWVGLNDERKKKATNGAAAEAGNGASTTATTGKGAEEERAGKGEDLANVTSRDDVFQDAALAPSMSRIP
ncbi:MoaE-domain-containing protein [Jaminaea rosea]|uniref:MoaE-domain-containing protein n=1 Tax=Jaminaea rosea TaxID=1569628 RepID=A0A316V1S8_9BASI|nr:MoaE-domain-containing protein [Jaminaea rosea]PWN29375.1 MoaE-domain-containing protein [Jaminaea rosea]